MYDKTLKAMLQRGLCPYFVNNKKEALDKLISLIPEGSTIINGDSATLQQIGYFEFLKNNHKYWHDLRNDIKREKDLSIQQDLHRQYIVKTDYYLGGVNAITEDGILVTADASGSRVGAYPYSAKKLVLVVSTQKIVPNLTQAFKRVREFVFPLVDKRSKTEKGINASFGKWVIIENEFIPERIQLILINEPLGF